MHYPRLFSVACMYYTFPITTKYVSHHADIKEKNIRINSCVYLAYHILIPRLTSRILQTIVICKHLVYRCRGQDLPRPDSTVMLLVPLL